MNPFLLDLAVILILAFCVWQGYRKGLILTVAGVLIIFIAAGISGKVASDYSSQFAEKIRPILGWVSDDAMDEASQGKGRITDQTEPGTLAEVARDTLSELGFTFGKNDDPSDLVFKTMSDMELSFREAVSHVFLRGVSRVILSVFTFIAVMILLTLLIHFLVAVFKLPGLKLIDKAGGLAAGLVYGLLIMAVIGWALHYAGILVPQEQVEKTVFLKLFYKSNLLGWLLGSIIK